MIADILSSLVRANLAGTAGVLVVLAMRAPARRGFGAAAAYGLWALPVVAAAAALLPQAQFASPIDAVTLDLADRAARLTPKAQVALWPQLLLCAWLVGTAVVALVLAGRQARFVGALGRLTALRPGEGIYRSAREGVGPAVVGVIRPRIVTPSDFQQRFSHDEQALIMAHERTHVLRGDPRANAVATAIQCLAWFNPLAHLAVRLMRIDQELACDADVLRARPTERRRYAQVLLKTQLGARPLPLGCQWPAAGEHPLKLRIATLAAPIPAAHRRLLGAAAVVVVLLSGGVAAWAAQPAPLNDGVLRGPIWLHKPSGRDLAKYYPKDAERRHMDGAATISCRVDRAGRLQACKVLGEKPLDGGFGQAALSMASIFQMAPKDDDGVSTAGHEVRIPILFKSGLAKSGSI